MSAVDIANVRELMIQQIQLLQELLATLGEEKTLLEQKQLDQLNAITATKSALLDRLKGLELAQYQQLKTLSNNPSEQVPSLKRLLSEHTHVGDTSDLYELFATLDALANQCSDQNRINGMLIHSRRKTNHQILTMLVAKISESTATTYGRNGATSPVPYSGTNLKA